MKALVVFDSNYGNTRKIAEVIARELGDDTRAISVSDFNLADLKGFDLLIAGSPTKWLAPDGENEPVSS